jgi:hypothetical protein
MAPDSASELELQFLTTNVKSGGLSIRRATIDDLDDLVDIALTAMPQDPQWNWRFPYRLQFPEDNRGFTRIRYEEFLRNADGQWLVMLAEAREFNGEAVPNAIAMAIWNVKNLVASKGNSKSEETSKCLYKKLQTSEYCSPSGL